MMMLPREWPMKLLGQKRHVSVAARGQGLSGQPHGAWGPPPSSPQFGGTGKENGGC